MNAYTYEWKDMTKVMNPKRIDKRTFGSKSPVLTPHPTEVKLQTKEGIHSFKKRLLENKMW